MTFFPAIELVDRLAIARVKWRRTGANGDELQYYEQQVQQLPMDQVCHNAIQELEIIHETIWDLEKELKGAQEANLSLSEIGRRAILIRDHNHRRITYKNFLAERIGCPVREIKREHLSE